MIPSNYLGAWSGTNRLWLEAPCRAKTSAATMTLRKNQLSYIWTFDGKEKTGKMSFFGPDAAVRADWTDTFHAAQGMVLHGLLNARVLRLFGTYAAGDGPDWGWQIELDCRDPDELALRMFNVPPANGPVPAVYLIAKRMP